MTSARIQIRYCHTDYRNEKGSSYDHGTPPSDNIRTRNVIACATKPEYDQNHYEENPSSNIRERNGDWLGDAEENVSTVFFVLRPQLCSDLL
jgi:hypothetical protein